jgi:GrpB-like predicted nucleotidyltransferase (UPF0157 family)
MEDALGLEPGVVRLAPYDARWPELFAAERGRLLDRCRGLALRFEHVGGTSIPGMSAKPILDIAAGRPGTTSPADCVAALQAAGYEHRGERGVPGREFFCRGQPRAYHLHLVDDGGLLWREFLEFRDYLRTHPEAARAFADLKRSLAERFGRDREAYMGAKSAHVAAILGRARGGG